MQSKYKQKMSQLQQEIDELRQHPQQGTTVDDDQTDSSQSSCIHIDTSMSPRIHVYGL